MEAPRLAVKRKMLSCGILVGKEAKAGAGGVVAALSWFNSQGTFVSGCDSQCHEEA